MENYHILIVSYLGATNTRGSRIKIKSERFEQSVTISYDHECNNSLDGAKKWLKENEFEVIGQGESNRHYYIISTTFKPLK